MNPSPDPRPRSVRYSARRQARLDAETHAKLEELTHRFHRKRAAILRFVMGWGVTQTLGWPPDRSISATVHLVPMLVNPELLQQVHDVTAAHGVSAAAWLRQAMRQVTPEDFPASWHAAETPSRSHASGYYNRRFQLRLDQMTQRKLKAFMQRFDRSAAEIIRQLIVQATPEDFPRSWQLAVDEQRRPPSR